MMLLATLGFITLGCGSSGTRGPANIDGSWFATLTDSNGTVDYSFSTTFTGISNNGLDITNFTFVIPGACFSPYSSTQYSETGSFTLGGNFNGSVTGTFGMQITTIFPTTNNVLTLNGTVSGNKITGTWSATGLTGCSGNGTFTIQPPMQGG
jgi:hypothetical protein